MTLPSGNLDRLERALLHLAVTVELASAVLEKRDIHGDAAARDGIAQIFAAFERLIA